MREQIIHKVLETKLIAIIRGIYGEDCVRLAHALHNGGIEMIEVTFDQAHPETFQNTMDSIQIINEVFKGEVLAGAGTVTSVELVNLAYTIGAKYIISPNVNKDVIKHTLELGMVSIPGAFSPTEILDAYNAGADFVKVFPTSSLGAPYIKAVMAPLNQVKLLAVGGVNEKNIADFLKAGAVGAGVGGNLVNKQWIAEGRFDEITALARAFANAVKK